MTSKMCNPEYLAKALLLKDEEKERVLSRMSGKLPRRLAKEKLTVDEALAIQLEIEDEQLAEWRDKMYTIKAKEQKKKEKPVAQEAGPGKAKGVKPTSKSNPVAAATTDGGVKSTVKTKKGANQSTVAAEPAPSKTVSKKQTRSPATSTPVRAKTPKK